MRAVAFLVVLFPLACASEEERDAKQRECEGMAEEIREAARSRGLPSERLCNNPEAPELGEACARLAKCNQELEEMDRPRFSASSAP